METLLLKKSERNYYKNGSGDYAYNGVDIAVDCLDAPDPKEIEEVEEKLNKLRKLHKKNPKLYIVEQMRVDFPTLKHYCIEKKETPNRSTSSCFQLTIYIKRVHCELHLFSPPVNFYVNSFAGR